MRRARPRPITQVAQSAVTPLIVSGVTLFALDLGRRLFRAAQLFCPTREPILTWNPADYGIPVECVEEQWVETPDGELLHAWYCRAEDPVASALYCHGNTGNLTNTAHVIPHLLESGISVFLFDYRGFGRSTGRPSLDGVVADAITAARYHDRVRPKELPSILYGYSLGGAIAAQAIQRHTFDGLVMQSTFTSLRDMARFLFPRVPLHYFSGPFFDSKDMMSRVDVPVLFIHGTDDEVVPCWMMHELFDACPAAKECVVIPGGLHKDLYLRASELIIHKVREFALSLPHNARESVAERDLVDEAIDGALRMLRRQLRRREIPPRVVPMTL